MKTIIDRILSIRITVKSIALIAIGIAIAMIINSVMSDGGGRNESSALEPLPTTTTVAPTTTTTSTTTTTTTTVPPVTAAPKPAKSELVRKVDELYPGASDKYGADTIEKAGKFACKRWNEAPITRINVIRDIKEYTGIDDLMFGHAVAEAVVWTICWETTSFPNGPREYR